MWRVAANILSQAGDKGWFPAWSLGGGQHPLAVKTGMLQNVTQRLGFGGVTLTTVMNFEVP